MPFHRGEADPFDLARRRCCGLPKRPGEAPAEHGTRERHELLRDRLAASAAFAEEPTFTQIERHERSRACAPGTCVDDRAHSVNSEQLETKGPKQKWRRLGLERTKGAKHHRVELARRRVLLGDLVGDLEDRGGRTETREVGADLAEGVDALDLAHDVELATAPAKECDVTEWLDASTDPALRAAHPFRDGTNLAVFGRQDRDDPVGLAESHRPKHDALVAIGRQRAPPRIIEPMLIIKKPATATTSSDVAGA